MTDRADVIRMAREAGLPIGVYLEETEIFAELVRAAEREKWAEVAKSAGFLNLAVAMRANKVTP